MPTLKFKSQLPHAILQDSTSGIYTTSSVNSQYIITGNNSSTSLSLLLIYQGALPDLTTLVDRSSRADDLLLSFSIPGLSQGFTVQNLSDRVQLTMGKCPTPTAASNSGIASWFLLCRSGTTSLTDKGAMLGTVGLPGSGADLTVPNTNIVSGNLYQSAGFIISFPFVWDL